MKLFLDRYPFRMSDDRSQGHYEYDPVLPLFGTSPRTKPFLTTHVPINPVDWAFDTCYTGEGTTSANFLKEDYGSLLLPFGTRILPAEADRVLPDVGTFKVRSSLPGSKIRTGKMYLAKIWIVSNLPAGRENPFPILLNTGLAIDDDRNRTLLGRTALFGTGLKVELHFDTPIPSLSVWVPEVHLLLQNEALLPS